MTVSFINESLPSAWHYYWQQLTPLTAEKRVQLAPIPDGCKQNTHMSCLKTAGLQERTALLEHLKNQDISAAFHYVPLHSARAGGIFGKLHGEDRYTTSESERLVRLPMWFGVDEETQQRVIDAVFEFYQ